MQHQEASHAPSAKPIIFAGLSLFTGLGAVAAKSCCLLPLLLASSGLGGAWLSRELSVFRPYFLAGAVLTLVVGWVVAIRRHKVTCAVDGACSYRRTSWLTFSLLGISTVMAGLAAAWGWIEPAIVPYLLSLSEST
jgi:mercuric ion transport protein